MRLLAWLAALLVATAAPAAPASGSRGPDACPAGAGVPVAGLPREAQATLRAIDAGGPHPYAQDGATFGNRERRLPSRPGGYYREYTVRTPGTSGRGARRIVAGRQGERWYTADHYRSFRCVEGAP
jgi:ribonuclease T1